MLPRACARTGSAPIRCTTPSCTAARSEVERGSEQRPDRRSLAGRLRRRGVLDDAVIASCEAAAVAEIDDAVAFAEAGTLEPTEDLLRHVYAEVTRRALARAVPPPRMTYREAMRKGCARRCCGRTRVPDGRGHRALRRMLRGDEGAARGVRTERIRDTPLSESAFVGAGVGAAIGGLRPIVEIMTVNFSLLALDQILNNAATLRHMSGGQLGVPWVIRMTTGAGRQLAAQHSHSLEGWYTHIPGPEGPGAGHGRGRSWHARPALCDPDPVVIFEHALALQHRRGVDEPPPEVDLEGRRAPSRRDVSLVTYGGSLPKVMAAAEELAADGVSAEVVDLRCLRPLDTDARRDRRPHAPRRRRRRRMANRRACRRGERPHHGAGVLRAGRAGGTRVLGRGADALRQAPGGGALRRSRRSSRPPTDRGRRWVTSACQPSAPTWTRAPSPSGGWGRVIAWPGRHRRGRGDRQGRSRRGGLQGWCDHRAARPGGRAGAGRDTTGQDHRGCGRSTGCGDARRTDGAGRARGGGRPSPRAVPVTTAPSPPPSRAPDMAAPPLVGPLIRRLADAEHVDLRQLHGSGARGRITRADVASAASSGARRGPGRAASPPRARRLARQLDVALDDLGGDGGHVVTGADIERRAAASTAPRPPAPAGRSRRRAAPAGAAIAG